MTTRPSGNTVGPSGQPSPLATISTAAVFSSMPHPPPCVAHYRNLPRNPARTEGVIDWIASGLAMSAELVTDSDEHVSDHGTPHLSCVRCVVETEALHREQGVQEIVGVRAILDRRDISAGQKDRNAGRVLLGGKHVIH